MWPITFQIGAPNFWQIYFSFKRTAFDTVAWLGAESWESSTGYFAAGLVPDPEQLWGNR